MTAVYDNSSTTMSDPADGDLDVSGYVRRVRRLADLSQRELAARLGLDQAQVSRIEGGRDISVSVFAEILAIAGLRLTVVDDAGSTASPMPADVLRDRAQRRRPAHLDVHTAPDLPSHRMLFRQAVAPEVWHHLRPERDRLRRDAGLGTPREQPTERSVARWRRDRFRRR